MRTAKVDEVRIDGLSYNQEHFEAMMNMQAQMEKSKYFYKPIKRDVQGSGTQALSQFQGCVQRGGVSGFAGVTDMGSCYWARGRL
jgi:hypothetical protein